jgi:acyl carrier protein
MQADNQTILDILKREVSLTGPVEVTASTGLRREAELDSLDLAVFLLAVQDKYGVKIPDEEVDKLDTIAAITDWMNAHMNGQ